MRCPVDDSPLREVTRQGVKVDLCSECRGIWLDRGELDHLLDAASAIDDAPARVTERPREERVERVVRTESRDRDDDDDDDRRDRARPAANPPKKRSSWLSELLEFGE